MEISKIKGFLSTDVTSDEKLNPLLQKSIITFNQGTLKLNSSNKKKRINYNKNCAHHVTPNTVQTNKRNMYPTNIIQ